MSSKYPNEYDLFETKHNATNQDDPAGDYVMAEDINELQDAITAIQESLGRNPQGMYDTVVERLSNVSGVQALRTPTVLVYLGNLPRMNNANSNDDVALSLTKFDHVVIGDDAQNPNSLTHDNVKLIIEKAKALKSVKFYGYLDASIASETLSEIQTKINQWISLGVDGIYCDKIGYDYQVSRDRQNQILESIHQYSIPAFVNATNPDDIFSDIFHATLNINRAPASIEIGDIYHLNDFGVNTGTTEKYVAAGTMFSKVNKLLDFRSSLGIKIFATATVDSSTASGIAQGYFDYAHALAILSSLDAFYATESGYSKISEIVPFYEQPPFVGQWYTEKPGIKQSGAVYSRETGFGNISVDTSAYTYKYNGISIPIDMLRIVADSLDGSVLKDNSVADIKVNYDGNRIVQVINNATTPIDASRIGGLLDETGGVAQTLIQTNVLKAINAQIGSLDAQAASIGALTAQEITTGSLQANRISASVVAAINLYAADMQVGDATIANAAIGSLSVDNMKANVIDAVNISAKDISADRMRANVISAINIFSDTITTEDAKIKTAAIGELSADRIQASVIQAINANITNAKIDSAVIDKLTAGHIEAIVIEAINAKIGNAKIDSAVIDNLTAGHIQAVVIDAIRSYTGTAVIEEAKIGNLSAAKITSGSLTTNVMEANVVKAINAEVDTAKIKAAVIDNLTAGHIQAVVLDAINARIGSTTIDSAKIGELEAEKITTGQIKADVLTANIVAAINSQFQTAIIDSAKIGSLSADHIQAVVFDAINGRIGTATIDSAKIADLDASKITSGDIHVDRLKAGAIDAVNASVKDLSADRMKANVISAVNGNFNNTTIDAAKIGVLTAGHIQATVIEAINGHINSATIDAAKIGTLTADHIKASVFEAINGRIGTAVIDGAKIGTLDAGQITTGSLQTDVMSANIVDAVNLRAGVISTGAAQIDSAAIGTLTAGHIQTVVLDAINARVGSATIDAAKIADLDASKITAGDIHADRMRANAITAVNLSADNIDAARMTANVIDAINIKAGQVTIGSAIIDNAAIGVLSADKIQANVIEAINFIGQTAQIAEARIADLSASKITAGDIHADRMKANVIDAVNLKAGIITAGAAKIDSAAVGTLSASHIQASVISAINTSTENLTVNAGKIGTLDVNNIKANVLAAIDASVETIKIGKGKIGQLDAANIEAGAITTDHIATEGLDAAVIKTGFISADRIQAGTINSEHIVTTGLDASVIKTGTMHGDRIEAGTIKSSHIETIGLDAAVIKTGTLDANIIGANTINSNHIVTAGLDATVIKTGTMHGDRIQANTLSSNHIVTAGLDAAVIKTGTMHGDRITAGTIKSTHIETAGLSADVIKTGVLDSARINTETLVVKKVQAGVIDSNHIVTTGLDAATIKFGTMHGDRITVNTLNGNRVIARSIDATKIVAGSITAVEISAGSITGDRLAVGTITSDQISSGSINSGHISTGGLDAQQVTVYNGVTGEVLIGAGYIRVNGLDTGVVQSDNLAANGLFMTASSSYGFKRKNPPGEAIVGTGAEAPGGNQIWKIDLATDTLVDTIDIPGKKPAFMAIDTQVIPATGDIGKYAYVTVQGDDTVIQVDLQYGTINSTNTLSTGKGPGRIKYYGDLLNDMKHFFMVNTDKNDVNAPDSFYVLDAPPTSNYAENDGTPDFYIHHQLVTGNMPYDFVLDLDTMKVFITTAEQGDILVLDATSFPTYKWKISGAIPIAEYGTDNYHGGMGAGFGFGAVNGGTSTKNYAMNHGGSGGGHGAHVHGGYGAPPGDMRTYSPRGIDLSTDKQFLYVVDNTNGQLLIVYKTPLGTAADPGHVHAHALATEEPTFSIKADGHTGHDMGTPGEVHFNYGPGTTATQFVKYRIGVGSTPEFVKVVGGKVFVSINGGTKVAVLDEATITADGVTDFSTAVRYIEVGSKPFDIVADPTGTNVYVSLNGTNEVVRINVASEQVTKRFGSGANVMGLAITPDGKYLYTVNNGGSGSLSFVYPPGTYIGDAYVGLEGGIKYQGAQFWTPYRTDWKDINGRTTNDPGYNGVIRDYAVVEFRINEPLLNEGGYTRLATAGKQYQMSYIEQDITGVTNYSDGSNIGVATAEILSSNFELTTFSPKMPWLLSYGVRNIRTGTKDAAGTITYVTPAASEYTIYYDIQPRIVFKNPLPQGTWVVADYTYVQNVWFKAHNASVLVAIENSSSSNFNTYFEVEEFVPKFISIDNQQTEPFVYSPIELPAETNADYTGMEYSVMTNRALGAIVTSSVPPTTGSLTSIVDGKEPTDTNDEHSGHTASISTSEPVFTIQHTFGEIVEFPGGLQNVTVDLGKAYMIAKVVVQHAFHQKRIYHNTKTEVSEDGVNWTTIYDSAVSGEYREYETDGMNVTTYGKVITFNAKPVRYVRDWANGYTEFDINWQNPVEKTENHWTEIKAYGDWEVEAEYFYNYALQRPQASVTTSGGSVAPTWGTGKTSDISYIVDGTVDPNLYFNAGTGNAYVQIDLGAVRKIDTIRVWHYYADVRTYHNTKTQISIDGNSWITVFDSTVDGEYQEMPSGKLIDLGGLTDVRYIRDWTNGCTVNGSLADPENRWIQIQALNGYRADYEYRYPDGSDFAGQNLATNGRCFVTTDISNATIAVDIPIDFTSWWWMSYIRGPQFGTMAMDMPTVMGGSHVLPTDYTYVTKEAHRHIMSFPPSASVEASDDGSIKAGKHRAIIRQSSGRISLDRIRFEDFQKFSTSQTVIPYNASKTFVRYKLVPDKARAYIGTGNQSTEGAYDTVRVNPYTKLPDGSVQLKYRMRIKAELSPVGNISERGVAYVTSAIFETGKNSTHWRRSEASDLIPGNRVEPWDGLQPHTTGIQWFHLANGAVRGPKILPHAIMDYHISPYAKIGEFKLDLNYPTHNHGHWMDDGTGKMMWHDSKADLDMVMGWGTSGTSYLIAHADHEHTDMIKAGDLTWTNILDKPLTFAPTTHTHTASEITDLTINYYDKTEVNTLVNSAGEVRLANVNTFTNMNLFTKYDGPAIKIQPSQAPDANTVLFQALNMAGNNLVTIDAEGDVVISGNLTVAGTQTNSGTQNIQGDYNVSGNLSVGGNTILGDTLADQTTVKGDLRVEGALKQIGKLQEVMRFPVYGIGGDPQFQTDDTTYQAIIDHYWTFNTTGNSALPAVPLGATRFYKLLVSYSDNHAGHTSSLRIVQQGTTTEITNQTLPGVGGTLGGWARTWLSPAFQTAYSDHTSFQIQRNGASSVVIKYIEVIAYDQY